MIGALYLDTSALVKLYINEPGSEWVQKQCESAESLPMSPLQETELKNAILAARGRSIIDAVTARQTLKDIETDLSEGCFIRHQPDWPLIWQRANQIAEAHTPTILCRTLDILHLALAESIGANQIITGDERQFLLCKAMGIDAKRIPG